MDFRSPAPGVRALRERAEHPFFGYGTEQPEFYEVFLDRLQKRSAGACRPRRSWTCPVSSPASTWRRALSGGRATGCSSRRRCTRRSFARPGQLRVHRARRRRWPRQPGGRYAIDFDRFGSAIRSRTRIFLLCNPHNPVAACSRAADLRASPRSASEQNLLICSDEIHCDLVTRAPARADRLARSRDRAAHDHADGAEQDLQHPRPQVLRSRSSPTRRSARSSWRPSSTWSGR